jgi:YebC/PmpR family DNA-binding regulatory protein
MSGHSKWSNIKNKKGKTDAQRAKVFTKIGREIASAIKDGGGSNPETNGKLRDVIAKARASNMPSDNILRSIQKAGGELGSVHYEEVVYEGYGVNGIAMVVETLTDNRNRTASDVRHVFDKWGGSLGTSGCVSYMFKRKGVLIVERTQKTDEDAVMAMALDAGASDFDATSEAFEIFTEISDFSHVREALEAGGLCFLSADIEWIPDTTVDCDEETAAKMEVLIERFEELDDVQNVYHNMTLS